MKKELNSLSQARRALRVIPKIEDLHVPLPELSSHEPETIPVFLKALFQEAFEKKPLRFDSPALVNGFLGAIQAIGTTNFKAPDAQVETTPIWGEPSPGPKGMLSEADIEIQRPLIFGGNATLLGFAGFLTASYRFDGEFRCILQSIVADDAVCAALVELGILPDDMDKLRNAAKSAQHRDIRPIPIHPLTKQIFWETEHGDPVLLVPVSSDRMVAEVARRLKESENSYVPHRVRISVGGTKPGNAGKVYLDSGGAALLMAVPPSLSRGLLTRLKVHGTVFGMDVLSNQDLEAFLNVVPATPEIGNQRSQDKEQEAYRNLVAAMLDAASHFAESVFKEIDPEGPECTRLREHNPALMQWLKHGRCTESDAEKLANHILEECQLLSEKHRYAPWNERIKSGPVIQRIREHLMEALTC